MLYQIKIYLLVCVVLLTSATANAQTNYAPAKVIYDVASSDATAISQLIDRVTLLQNIYQHDSFDASIILVAHEGAIPFFTKNNNTSREFVERVKNLALAEIVQIRVCETSANMQGLGKEDFDSFIQLVPMADAEIIKLQNNGYAYLK